MVSNNKAIGFGGGIFMFNDNSHFYIKGSTFEANFATSGAGFHANDYNHHLNFRDTSFLSNIAELYGSGLSFGIFNYALDIINCNFIKNTADFDGGGINIYESNHDVKILRCKFLGNIVDEGSGLVLYQKNYLVVVDDCDFSLNTALASGAAMYIFNENYDIKILNSRISDNIAVNGGAGVYVNDGNSGVLFYNCSITDNIADVEGASSDGGGLYINTKNENVTIQFCSIVGNLATNEGGGVYINSHNPGLTIRDCLISRNFAKSTGGGAVIFLLNGNVTLENNIFDSNRASINGGGLAVYSDNNNLCIKNSLFNNNTSGDMGGGFSIAQRNDNMSFINVNVTYNRANGFGGGGYVWNLNQRMSLTNCLFDSNVATFDGGGLYLYRYNFRLYLHKTVFLSNSVLSEDGGGLYFKLNNAFVYISHCLFENNAAPTSGGAVGIRSNNDNIHIEDTIFIRNDAGVEGGAVHSYTKNSKLTFSRSKFESNNAVDGGAVYIGTSHLGLTFVKCNFIRNHAIKLGGAAFLGWYGENLLIEECNFNGNYAQSVGALLVRSLDILIRGTVFSRNGAQDTGGAYISTEYGTIENCTFVNNTANGLVGGMFVSASLNFAVIEVLFESNVARTASGGLGILDSGNITVQRSQFLENHGLDGGGILCAQSYDISVHESLFARCTASRATAIKFTLSNNVTMSNSTFTDNIASTFGTVNIVDCDDVYTFQNVFDGNIAEHGSGSAMAIQGGRNMVIKSSIFSNNSAPSGSGTVYWNTRDTTEPQGLTGPSNYFSVSNSAMYGPLWATEGIKLTTSGVGFYHIEDYDEHAPPVVVQLVDYYNQTVVTDSFSYIDVSTVSGDYTCAQSAGHVSGGVLMVLESGVANFTTLDLTCAAGYNMTLVFSLENGNVAQDVESTKIDISFRKCVRGEFYQDYACIPCPIGTYGFYESDDISELKQSDICQRCPDEATVCYADVIELDKGYWRARDVSDYILECPMSEASCIGGRFTSDSSCNAGYLGPLCAVCAEDYHYTSLTNTCELCTNEVSWLGGAVTTLCLFVVAVATVLCVLRLKKKAKAETMSDLLIHYLIKWKYLPQLDESNTRKEWIEEYIRFNIVKKITVRARIYVTFYQILEILPFVLDLTFPQFYNAIGSLMSILNLDVTFNILAASECSKTNNYNHDFIDRLIVSTTYPFIVLALVQLILFLHIRLRQRKLGKASSHDMVLNISANYKKLSLVFISVILPGISSIIFATFSCTDVDSDNQGQSYMTVDYSIECYTDRYYFAFSWALVMIFVYPIGILVYIFTLLFQHKTSIMERSFLSSKKDRSLDWFNFLYEIYRPKFWYWEVVEMFFRLSVTGLLVLAKQGSTEQIIIGIFFSLFFIKAYDVCQPYIDKEIKSVKEISLWQIFFIFCFAFGIRTNMLTSASDSTIIFLLILIVSFNLMVDLLKLSLYTYGLRRGRTKDDSDFLNSRIAAEELDKEIMDLQVRLGELSSIRNKRMKNMWTAGGANDASMPDSSSITNTCDSKTTGEIFSPFRISEFEMTERKVETNT